MSGSSPEQPPKPRLSPTALSVADAALLLTKLGDDPSPDHYADQVKSTEVIIEVTARARKLQNPGP